MCITKQFFDCLQSVSRFLISILFIHKLALLYVLDFIAFTTTEALHSHNWANSGTRRAYSHTFILRKQPFHHLGRLLRSIFLMLSLNWRL